MNKISIIPDWIHPKELFIIWPENLPSCVGTSLIPLYKRFISKIYNVSIHVLINSNTIPKNILESNVIWSKLNTGDVWLRDFMPIAARNSSPHYFKFQYKPSYLSMKDELIRQLGGSTPGRLTKHFSDQNLKNENLILDGGTFISNGMGTAITTNRVISDNQHLSITELTEWFRNRMGIEHLIILPVEPGDITGHVDGMVRFIDRSMVVVGDYPSSYKIGKEFMDRISETMTQNGFKVVRVLNDVPIDVPEKFPSAVGNYINYLRIGNTIYLPIYKGKEMLNNRAIAMFESLALEVIPVFADEIAEHGGVLNCITWHYY